MPYMEQKMSDLTREQKNTPLLKTINDFMKLIKFFMILVFVAYLFSGITLIKPGQIGIILRMGKIVGDNPADQIHDPGWIFALPKPFDQVLVIPDSKSIQQIQIKELASNKNIKKDESGNISTIDPTIEGYCISGDDNIFQTSIFVKYQITDPIKLIFGYSSPFYMVSNIVHDFTVAEMTNVSNRFTIEGLFTKDKKILSQEVQNRLQKKLEAIDSGLTIISLEISEMNPPPFLKFDFEDVQSAYVDQFNFIKKAESRKEIKIPTAKADYEKAINDANAYSEKVKAEANSKSDVYLKMLEAYNQNKVEVGLEMKNKALNNIIKNSGNVILFPDLDNSPNNVTLLLGMNGSVITKITTPDGYYEEDD